MLLAIEGPDYCGKTTLFAALMRETWVGKPRMIKQPDMSTRLFEHVDELERRELPLWAAIDRAIVDRFTVISNQVYGRLYGRPLLDPKLWHSRVVFMYLRQPLEVLIERSVRGDKLLRAKLERVSEAYDAAFEDWLGPKCVLTGSVDDFVRNALAFDLTRFPERS